MNCQKTLFSSYRLDQYADPDGFVTQLAVVLEQFPDEVIRYVTDPRTGLQRRLKWPPTIAEVVQACEEHQDYLARIRKPLPKRLPEPPRDAEMVARISAGFAELVAQLKTPDTRPSPFPAEPRTCHADELAVLSDRAKAVVRDQTKTQT